MTELYPAIDLRGGRAVRLLRGDYAAETVYSDDPVAVARSFAAAGARWIHVVDLDAARSGEAGNLESVRNAHVDPRSNGQPIEPRTVPTRLDQYAGELASGHVQVVRPLERDRVDAESVERRGKAKGEAKRQNP